MDYYYRQTFQLPQQAMFQPKKFLKSQEKESQSLNPDRAEKAGHQDQTILLQDPILQVPEVVAVLIMEINYM